VVQMRALSVSYGYVVASALVVAGCGAQANPGDSNGNAGTGAITGNPVGPAAGTGAAGEGAAGTGIVTGGTGAGDGAAGAGIAGTGVAGDGTAGTGTAGDGTAGTGMAGDGVAGTGAAGTEAGTGGNGGAGGAPMVPAGACTPPPSGTFQTVSMQGGPGGNYTIVRPRTLGEGGFLHPPVAWGNGLGTTPSLYTALLQNLASQGFVVIANPGTGSNPMVVRQGLEWLIAQNGSGEFAGKLAVNCAGTIGYSMGGGAAVGSGSHPAVKAVVSIHGLNDAAERASGPVLILTAEGDTFVTKSGFAVPCYTRSTVQPTILASHAGGDHLDPIGSGGMDAAPAVAWLRYWIYGDQAAREWFFGASCRLCSWPDFRRKNHNWD
jgi:hypothetical protein